MPLGLIKWKGPANFRAVPARCVGEGARERPRAAAMASGVALVMMDTRVPDTLIALASAPTISLKYNVSTLQFTYYLNLRCARTTQYRRLATATPTGSHQPPRSRSRP